MPEDFPNAIPQIFVEGKSLGKRIPHIEKDGKLCLAPNTGILIDSTKPKGIVSDSLERASKLIQDGLSEKNKEDFLTEYQAYWNAEETIQFICNPDGEDRVVVMTTLTKDEKGGTFFFDDYDSAKKWATKTEYKITEKKEAFLIHLTEAFYPPDFDRKILQFEIFDLIKSYSSAKSFGKLKLWLAKNGLPAVIVLGLPLNNSDKVFIGVRIEKLEGKLKEEAQKGFRPGKVPVPKELLLGRKKATTKIRINRLDPKFLLKRGGANNDLLEKIVTIIGCGSIGSHLVTKLAALGVGNLRLIDSETFEAENLHRHALGMTDIGKNKAQAMTELLERNYPHLNIEYRGNRIEKVFSDEPSFVLNSDLVLIALGDETLELFLNDSLPPSFKRLHVWVEPLSIGGHLLLTGINTIGCFRCLFSDDSTIGIYNQASLAEPAQNFLKSYSGCAGVFTPFSAIDADKAANEAATLAARILLRKEEKNLLVSWRGYDDDFINAGYKLSSRGKLLSVNEKRIEENFANPSCATCGIKI